MELTRRGRAPVHPRAALLRYAPYGRLDVSDHCDEDEDEEQEQEQEKDEEGEAATAAAAAAAAAAAEAPRSSDVYALWLGSVAKRTGA